MSSLAVVAGQAFLFALSAHAQGSSTAMTRGSDMSRPETYVNMRLRGGVTLRVIGCWDRISFAALGLPPGFSATTATGSGNSQATPAPSEALRAAVNEAQNEAKKVCDAQIKAGLTPAEKTESALRFRFLIYPQGLPSPEAHYSSSQKKIVASPLEAEWSFAAGYIFTLPNQTSVAQQSPGRQASPQQQAQLDQRQGKGGEAAACRSAASQVTRRESVQQPKGAIAPTSRLSDAEVARQIREKLGLPILWSTYIGGIGQTEPLYREAYCLVAEGYVQPGQGIIAAQVSEKGKPLIKSLMISMGRYDFEPYTHRVDVKKIESVLSDNQRGAATVTYELVLTPTEYFEKLRQLDPKSMDAATKAMMREFGEGKRRMDFKRWDQGWLPAD